MRDTLNFVESISDDFVEFFNKVPVIFISSIVTTIASFVLVWAFTNFSDKAIYGQFSYITSIFGILSLFCLPGMNTAIIQGISKGENGIFKKGTFLKIKYGIFGTVVAIIITILFKKEPDQIKYLILLSFIFPLVYSLDTASAYLNGVQRFKSMAILNIIAIGIPITFTGLIIFLFPQKLFLILLTYFCATALINLISIAYINKKYISKNNYNPKLLTFGKHLSIITVLGNLQSYLDKVIVGTFFSFTQLAVFSVGKLFQKFMKMLWGIFYQIELPKLSRISGGSSLQAFNVTKRLVRFGIILFAGLGIVIILLIPFIIKVFFTKDYSESCFYAQLFVVASIIGIPGGIYELLMRSSDDMTKQIYIFRVSFSVLELILLCLFPIFFGLLGVIYAQICARIFSSTFSGYLCYQRFKK